MKLKPLLLVTAALSALVRPVEAGENSYVSLFGGWTNPETTRAHLYGSSAYDISREDGFVLGGALGTHLWSEAWRGEFELAHAKSDVSEVFYRGNATDRAAFGDLAHLTLMANLWRDFTLPAMPIHPYLGGGLGVALTLPDWCYDSTGGGTCSSNGEGDFNTSEPALAAQAGAGLRFPMSGHLMLDLGYRLRAIIGADMAGNYGDAPPGKYSLIGADFITHSLQAGLSFVPGGIVEPSGEEERWYISLFGGLSIPETTRAHYWGTSAHDISRENGFVLGGALGTYLWNDYWRGELELAYAKSDVSGVFDRYNGDHHDAFGDLAHLTLMANLWRDFSPAGHAHSSLSRRRPRCRSHPAGLVF